MVEACDPSSEAFPRKAEPAPQEEERFLHEWDADIRRSAAKSAGLGVEAADLAQETRLHLLRVLRKRRLPSTAYTRRVISNSVRKARRREVSQRDRMELFTLSQEHEERSCTPADDGDFLAREAVAHWINDLPGRMREIYDLVYRRELTQRAAALAMGLSQPRIAKLHKQLLRRGIHELAYLVV